MTECFGSHVPFSHGVILDQPLIKAESIYLSMKSIQHHFNVTIQRRSQPRPGRK